jgi:uncharacterized protein YbbK (DUF523 family)
MILVSGCLAGICCRYDGNHTLVEEIKEMVEAGEAIAVCPEVMGGLKTPRIPCEIRGEKVINQAGENKTVAFVIGARLTLEIAEKYKIKTAVLKANSPSCGYGMIYDGSFSGIKIKGNGITAQMLSRKGITIYSEENFNKDIK